MADDSKFVDTKDPFGAPQKPEQGLPTFAEFMAEMRGRQDELPPDVRAKLDDRDAMVAAWQKLYLHLKEPREVVAGQEG